MTRITVLLLIAFSLGEAVQRAEYQLQLSSVWLVVALLGAVVLVVGETETLTERTAAYLLAALLVFQLVRLGIAVPAMYLTRNPTETFVVGCAAVTPLVLVPLVIPETGRWLFPAVLLVFVLLGAWVIRASPTPAIDVDVFQRDSLTMLLKGFNPYALRPPSIYPNGTAFYGPGMVEDGRVQFGYPYPPLSLLLALPGHMLFGDYRYSQLAAMAGAGAFIAYTRPSRFSFGAAALMLFTPRSFFVLEQGWTEPFVLLAAALFLFCCVHFKRPSAIALGLFIASKQYVILVAWPLLFGGRRIAVWSIGVAAVVTLPFILWSPHHFWVSVVASHVAQPFRADALTVPAMLGWPWLAGAGWILGPMAFSLALVRQEIYESGYAAAAAVSLLFFFAFGKQAGANYYWLVIGLLAFAAGLVDVPRAAHAPAHEYSGR